MRNKRRNWKPTNSCGFITEDHSGAVFLYAHRPFRKIGKRKQGGRIVFYAKEQLKCMEQDQRRCQQGGGGHSEHLLQTTWLRTWSGWDLLETIWCSLPIACLTCLLQQTFPSKNMLVRDLNSGIDIHVKLEKKTNQSKANQRPNTTSLTLQPTNKFLCQNLAANSGKKESI